MSSKMSVFTKQLHLVMNPILLQYILHIPPEQSLQLSIHVYLATK